MAINLKAALASFAIVVAGILIYFLTTPSDEEREIQNEATQVVADWFNDGVIGDYSTACSRHTDAFTEQLASSSPTRSKDCEIVTQVDFERFGENLEAREGLGYGVTNVERYRGPGRAVRLTILLGNEKRLEEYVVLQEPNGEWKINQRVTVEK